MSEQKWNKKLINVPPACLPNSKVLCTYHSLCSVHFYSHCGLA